MLTVIVYRTRTCPYCHLAAGLLARKGVTGVREIAVDSDPLRREEMLQRSNGRRTVPQIFIGDHHVGGYDDLVALERSGELDALLGADATQPG